MTFLQIIKEVYRKLREDEPTASNDDEYSILIAGFVNDAKREVEEAWNWTQLRQVLTLTTAVGDYDTVLTGAGDRFRILKDEHGRALVYNTTQRTFLTQVPSQKIRYWRAMQDVVNNTSSYFAFEGVDTNGDPKVLLHEPPNAIENIEFNCVVPQPDMALDATDDSTQILVPSQPVVLRAWAWAIAERGEDGGTSSNDAAGLARGALADAVMLDQGLTGEMEAVVR